MLTHVHVKNMALIDEAEIDFGPGLNILTGETGAGKSILIGSVAMALGQKTPKDMIREGEEYALAELVFEPEDERVLGELAAAGIEPEEGQIILSRKIRENRSICRINTETCTLSALRETAELLLDLHGQHEHQSLLKPAMQLSYLDQFGGNALDEKKTAVREAYRKYTALKKELESYTLDEESRLREMDFLNFEITEIEEAAVRPGEDEELELRYRRMTNARKITEALSEVRCMLGNEENGSVGSQLGRAVSLMNTAASADEGISPMLDALADLESLTSDLYHDLGSYLDDLVFSGEEFRKLEQRLDLINHLKSKYGSSTQEIEAYLEKQRQSLEDMEKYEENKLRAQKAYRTAEKKLQAASEELSAVRRSCAARFEKELTGHLKDLNFADIRFSVAFGAAENYTDHGTDSVEFMISTNPGEPIRPLAQVASGGELSRIMLGIRTLLAKEDHVETLIFDEIDTGISGRTAQKVAEKMALIAGHTQVLCITHLPQIAAQADHHYEIGKSVSNGKTATKVHRLNEAEMIGELARMLGGASITEAVLENAREMKRLAKQQ